MKLPDYIKRILERIEERGYQAYVVGGAVRDGLLERQPSDYDITTNALPGEIENIFSQYKTIDVGKKFGSILVIYEGEEVEITSYRADGKYIDGRRPERVYFSKELREDLRRRDFTINAMAYGFNGELRDYFSGREDLERGLIRTVGDPFERFGEDYLRILRAVRFAAQLNFEIEAKTILACKQLSKEISKVSKERIGEELFKILKSDNPAYGIELLRKTGLLEIVLPELYKCIGFEQNNPNHHKDVYDHTLAVVERVPNKLELRLAAVFHDLGKVKTYTVDEEGIGHFYGHEEVSRDMAIDILRRYNSPRSLIDKVGILVENHMVVYDGMKSKGMKRLIRRMGEEDVFLLLELQIADRLGTRDEERDISDIIKVKNKIEDIISSEEVYDEKQLAINGNDVIELGYKEGRKIGEILSFAMDTVLEDEGLNQREKLLNIIREKFKD